MSKHKHSARYLSFSGSLGARVYEHPKRAESDASIGVSQNAEDRRDTNHDLPALARDDVWPVQATRQRNCELPDPEKRQSESPLRLQIESRVLSRIRDTIGALPPETGGALGMDVNTNTIVAFDFDESACRSGATYSPDVKRLNEIVRPLLWSPLGVKFCGFVHSHPGSFAHPSGGDRIYASNILKAMTSIDRLVMPIVLPERMGHDWQCNAFVARVADDGVEIVPTEFVPVSGSRYVLSSADTFDAGGISIRALAPNSDLATKSDAKPARSPEGSEKHSSKHAQPAAAESGEGATTPLVDAETSVRGHQKRGSI